MRAVKLVIDFRSGTELGRRMERHPHHDFVERLVLHAGALAENLATEAAQVRVHDLGTETGRRLAETGQSIALLMEAATDIIRLVHISREDLR